MIGSHKLPTVLCCAAAALCLMACNQSKSAQDSAQAATDGTTAAAQNAAAATAVTAAQPPPETAEKKPVKVEIEVPPELDVAFVPPEDDGKPAAKCRGSKKQPDQTPMPVTVGELIKTKPCSTALTSRLNAQLAAQMNCIKPNTFARIDDIEGVSLDQAANPFMQSAAVKALRKVVAARPEHTFQINSSWRSLVQQHVLKGWEGTCGIRVAADPGTSHHESGLAIDVPKEVTKQFRRTLRRNSFSWYCDETNGGRLAGCRDAPHYRFVGGFDVRKLSVKAFQMLWNRAHPDDPLPTEGDYGPKTIKRINMSPLSGFETGTTCSQPLSFKPTKPSKAQPE